MPKHLQFAQINKKFQSDVNKKLIVQRPELIVSEKDISFNNWAKAIEKNCNVILTSILKYCRPPSLKNGVLWYLWVYCHPVVLY